MARRSHPHLFSIYDGGVHEGRPYLLVQELDGQSFRERIRSQPLPVAEAVELIITLANTVHFLHEAGIVQLDLIPIAIFLSKDHRWMIDLQRTIERRVLSEEGSWIPGGITGCEAPEVIKGRDVAIGREVDVYALGAILYQTLTRRAALIQGAGGLEAIRKILESNPEPIRTFNRQVDRYLESICLRCLAKDPKQRFDSARSLGDELERWQSGIRRPAILIDRLRRRFLAQ
jgi:serine/threonine-protein kinase